VDDRLLQLGPNDNVCVLKTDVQAGQTLNIGEAKVVLPEALGVGHKVAYKPIAAGEKVLKLGAPIGSAKRDIAIGEHVHTHNLKSDYTPTYTLDGSNPFISERAGI